MASFTVPASLAGARLDVALATVAELPRAQARRWIDEGLVRVNGQPCRAAQRVHEADHLETSPPEPVPLPVEAEAIELRALHEDADLIVVDKPAGMVVHPAPGHGSGTLVHALLHHCSDLAGVGGVLRPGIVHRLDRGTSGVLVVAKNDAAHASLSAQFKDHSIERLYRAWVRALPGAESGVVDRPIGRHRSDRKRMSVRTNRGREARTRWRVVRRYMKSNVSELEIRPETGRTHQIRVHLAACGMPIVGDPVYGRGGASFGLDRPALHAERLGFVHPRSGARMRFEAALPDDLANMIAMLQAAESGS